MLESGFQLVNPVGHSQECRNDGGRDHILVAGANSGNSFISLSRSCDGYRHLDYWLSFPMKLLLVFNIHILKVAISFCSRGHVLP